jgi:hypothetical protein
VSLYRVYLNNYFHTQVLQCVVPYRFSTVFNRRFILVQKKKIILTNLYRYHLTVNHFVSHLRYFIIGKSELPCLFLLVDSPILLTLVLRYLPQHFIKNVVNYIQARRLWLKISARTYFASLHQSQIIYFSTTGQSANLLFEIRRSYTPVFVIGLAPHIGLVQQLQTSFLLPILQPTLNDFYFFIVAFRKIFQDFRLFFHVRYSSIKLNFLYQF